MAHYPKLGKSGIWVFCSLSSVSSTELSTHWWLWNRTGLFPTPPRPTAWTVAEVGYHHLSELCLLVASRPASLPHAFIRIGVWLSKHMDWVSQLHPVVWIPLKLGLMTQLHLGNTRQYLLKWVLHPDLQCTGHWETFIGLRFSINFFLPLWVCTDVQQCFSAL